MSKVQAVLFDINVWNTKDAREWLNKHNMKPLKRVHITENYYRYRLRSPRFKRYTLKDLDNGIKLVIGFN